MDDDVKYALFRQYPILCQNSNGTVPSASVEPMKGQTAVLIPNCVLNLAIEKIYQIPDISKIKVGVDDNSNWFRAQNQNTYYLLMRFIGKLL